MKIEINGKSKYIFYEKDLLGDRKNGKFSFVYKGIDTDNDSLVSIKKLNPLNKNQETYLQNFKVEGAYRFQHENLQRTLDFIESNGDYYIINEYVEGIDLLAFAKKNKKLFKKDNIVFKNIFIQVLEALKYLHQNNFIHLDVKPHNIIVDYQEEKLKVKLIDFGQVQNIKGKKQKKQAAFSLVYSSPEQFLKAYSLYNETLDFYSLGITIYHVLTGKLPYKTVKNPLMLMALQLNYKIEEHKKISSKTFKIIEKATSKYVFPKPYIYYPKEQVLEMLRKGQGKRYQAADEFIYDLEKL